MNTFLNNLKETTNTKLTENGGVALKSTLNDVYDMFAFGGAYRKRNDADVILLFQNAYETNPLYALKCLFYLRDVRGGQGERRFFRVCYNWLAQNYPEVARLNLELVAEYGRYDDLLCLFDTPVEKDALNFIKNLLVLDMECKAPSLLAKWMPSENASSIKTKKNATKIREFLGMSHKQYRKTLSILRGRINVLEKLMSAGRWDEIEFDKIPSKAGLKYRNAFARRDMIAKKYEQFAKSTDTKVNASTLYPYDIVREARTAWGKDLDNTDRLMVNKYWENQKDWLEGEECSLMCVVDTSGSMHGTPIDVAIGLGIYCAERLNGPFKDYYISFASKPQFIKVEGVDFVDKVQRIYKKNLCDNTNLTGVFDLLKDVALRSNPEDVPETIVVISDMEIDSMARGDGWCRCNFPSWNTDNARTEMEKVRAEWAAAGLKMPRLVYWNVDSRNNTILDAGPNVSFVSGCSPTIFKQVVTGVSGMDLMLQTLDAERYNAVRA